MIELSSQLEYELGQSIDVELLFVYLGPHVPETVVRLKIVEVDHQLAFCAWHFDVSTIL